MHVLIIYISIFAIPVLSYLITFRQKKFNHKRFIYASTLFCLLLVLITIYNFFKIMFVWQSLNISIIILTYITYCYIVWNIKYLKNIKTRRILNFFGIIPIVSILLISTIAFMAVIWVIGDYTNKRQTERIVNQNFLNKSNYGWVGLGGKHLTISKRYKTIPILEKKIFEKKFADHIYDVDNLNIIEFKESNQFFKIKISDKTLELDTLIKK